MCDVTLTFAHPTQPNPAGAAPAVRSPRADEVARWFGVDEPAVARRARRRAKRPHATSLANRCTPAPPTDDQLRALLPARGQIVLVSGPSGAGKSSLLASLRELAPRQRRDWLDLSEIVLPPAPVVDCFGSGAALDDVLALLSRVGLAEVWTYLRTPAELSEGQRWRLRVAIAMRRASHRDSGAILAMDEFAALLDRITASVVAHTLRRAIDGSSCPLGAIVATSHDDLLPALRPDLIARCDFGRVTVTKKR